jgi:hypothetical protein
MAKTDTAPAVETDALDESRVGSFAGWGAVVAVFQGDLLSHLEYPPAPTTRRYEVDPTSGLITRRLA